MAPKATTPLRRGLHTTKMSREFCDECSENACLKTLGLSKLLRKDWPSNSGGEAATPARQEDVPHLLLLDTTPINSSSLREDINSEKVAPSQVPPQPTASPTQKLTKSFSPSGRVSLGTMEKIFYSGEPKHIPFSADMFAFDKNKILSSAESSMVKTKSVESTDALLGYLIRIEQSSRDGLYLVTGMRKQRGKATEFCLISRTEKIEKDPRSPTVTYAELWMTLQRAEGKSGVKFSVVRNALLDM